jgi:hypothetical protein
MLVYGDHRRQEDPRAKLARIAADLERIGAMPGGIERHGALVAAFIRLGELAQGLVDREFAERGIDARSPASDAVMRALIELARAVGRSWEDDFSALGAPPLPWLQSLHELDLPQTIEISLPEGYAFYALYPEAYLDAAKALAGRPLKVIGLRSIGTSLAAAVAAASNQRAAMTVRPTGHPFSRSLALSDDLREELLSEGTRDFAIVDEGPGLSGSSFGCVADFLEDAGIDRRRIHFFPSHSGDLGPQASPRHRERWASAQRHVVGFEDLFLSASSHARRLEGWVSDVVGKPTEPLIDISGGAWRRHRYASEAEWPPVNAQQERRKFILRTEAGAWLLKFAGLGRYGAEKLEVAKVLGEGSFIPAVAAVRHGFLIEPWLDDARTLEASAVDRARLLRHLGHYLGFRARHLPAPRPGASLEALWTMAARNIGLALGEEFARRLDAWQTALPALSRHVVPIRTDNRLHAWEWLVEGERLIKADAFDHHAAHDLVGCQDLAWDIAGAAVEFGLSLEERERLCTIAEREADRPLVPELLDVLTVCYLAFQLGWYSLAADATADAPESQRLRAMIRAYAERLRTHLLGERPHAGQTLHRHTASQACRCPERVKHSRR